MMTRIPVLFVLIWATALSAVEEPNLFAEPDGVRLKDLVTIDGMRDNQLHGIGIVVGLGGAGDSNEATLRLARQVLASKKVRVADNDFKTRAIALVAVTADLPPFARKGTRLDTTVSAIGDAKSLRGGVLLQTFLTAPNGDIYAAAQGTIDVGGFGEATPGLVPTGVDHQTIETVGVVANGSIVERELPVTMLYGDQLRLVLREPDFTTATRVAGVLSELYGADRVIAQDAATVALTFPREPSDDMLVKTIAELHQLRVTPDVEARVVINARTGTVVIGQDVKVSAVAISHGGLSLQVVHRKEILPDPTDPQNMMEAETWTDPVSGIRSPESPDGIVPLDTSGSLTLVDGATVQSISNALNAIGARPKDMVAIFQALKRAGALHAELVVM
jgi:flagellar P-ring protein precursor FlgI